MDFGVHPLSWNCRFKGLLKKGPGKRGSIQRSVSYWVVNLATKTPTEIGLEDRRELQRSFVEQKDPVTCSLCGDKTEWWVRNPVDDQPIGVCCRSYCPRYEVWSEKSSGDQEWPSHKCTMNQGKAIGFAKERARVTDQRAIVALHGPPAPDSCSPNYEGVEGPIVVVHPGGQAEKRKVDGFHVDELDPSSILRRSEEQSTGRSTPWSGASPADTSSTTSEGPRDDPDFQPIDSGYPQSAYSSDQPSLENYVAWLFYVIGAILTITIVGALIGVPLLAFAHAINPENDWP